MPNKGSEVDNYRTIKNLIDDKRGINDRRHYFYMIKMPDCGSYRIKLGKSSNIYARFKYYQEHFYGSQVQIKRLRVFPNTDVDRYGDNAMKLYSLFEKEAQHALRNFNKVKNMNGDGKLTEWFDSDVEGKLLKGFDKFVEEFQKMKFDKTNKKKGLRSKNEGNISDSDSDEEEDTKKKNINSSRTRYDVIRYKPN